MTKTYNLLTTKLEKRNKTPHNKVLPKAGLNGFDWAFMQGSTFVLRLNFCAKNPRLRKAANRYKQAKQTACVRNSISTFMFNLSKKEHLESIITHLRTKGYRFGIKDKKILSDSYIALTVTDKNDYLEIKLKRKWTRIFGHYHIRLLSSNIILVDQLEKANQYAEKKTGYFNFEKKKFHRRINSAILNLRQEQINIFSSAGGIEKLKQNISDLKTNPLYEEKLSVFDYVKPAIGIEIDDNGIHPVFGIAVGGDRSGGLILFDPFEGQLELGGYLGFGNFGIYDSVEFDVTDSASDSVDLDDWDWD